MSGILFFIFASCEQLINVSSTPTMTYGSETWSTTKHLESKLQLAQRATEQQMWKISLRDKVSQSHQKTD